MLKKIILFFVITLVLFTNTTFAKSIPIEDVFVDINKDYIYYDELQTLYDKGMITPDSNNKFNPLQLLTREEFVGIMMESTCSNCIKPNVDYTFIKKYENKKLFFDLTKESKYFYCVAAAKDEEIVKGYHIGDKCEDGSYKEAEIPFCPNNTIILEEAIAVILRASGIMTELEANNMMYDIANGKKIDEISEDVGPFNLDGSIYSFFPYLKKALEYELVEYDTSGNKNIYNILSLKNGKIRPKQSITKQDFLKIAYVIFKANSCREIDYDNVIPVNLEILEKGCNENIKDNCRLSNLRDLNDIYDLYGYVPDLYDSGLGDENFIWRIYNKNTGKEDIVYGKYIDNYLFEEVGEYKINLRVIDDDGNIGEAYTSLEVIDDNQNFIINVINKPSFGTKPLVVEFEGFVSGGKAPYKYSWDFKDGNRGYGSKITNVFQYEGDYEVELLIEDSNGNFGKELLLIKVISQEEKKNLINGTGDGDGDGDNGTDDGNGSDDNGTGDGNGSDDNGTGDGNGSDDNGTGDGNGDDDDGTGDGNGDDDNGTGDYDDDGSNDLEDLCPLVKGDKENFGCPINEIKCDGEGDCKSGFFCNSKGYCEPNPVETSCEYSGNDLIMGNVICNSCPCSNVLDFTADVRKCDIIFPAITSPDQTIIYGKGNLFQITE